MPYTPPVLRVEIAFEDFDTDWADIDPDNIFDVTDKVRAFSHERGRNDQLAEFEPGTATLVIDNTTGEFTPGSGVTGAGVCRPMMPLRVTAEWDGDTYPVFAGHLGPEPWQVDRAPHGEESTVSVSCVERSSVFLNVPMPSSPFAAFIETLNPLLWVRGDAGKGELADGDTLYDSGSAEAEAVVVDSGGGELVYLDDSLIPNDDGPGLFCEAGARIRTGPNAGEADYTVGLVWSGEQAASDQIVIRQNQQADGLGDATWRMVCNTSGVMVLTVYDNSGTAVTFDVAPDNPVDSGGRWDDGNPHLVVIRINSSAATPQVKFWVDGQDTTITDAGIPDPYNAGYIFFGTTAADVSVDEFIYWSSLISTANVLALTRVFQSSGMPFAGDTFDERIERIYGLCGWSIDVDEPDQWHSAATDPTLWGLGSVNSYPSNLAEALRQVAESYLGAMWCTSEGRLRIRTQAALDDAAYEADYRTAVGHLTDEATPAVSPTPVRRGPVEFSGRRLDRVVNEATISVGTGTGHNPTHIARFFPRDLASQSSYGVRTIDISTMGQDADWALALGDGFVQRWKVPPIEIQDVVIDPWGDDDATGFVLGLDLEQLVKVTDTPPVGYPYRTRLNVQGIGWEWADGMSWTVKLALAKVVDIADGSLLAEADDQPTDQLITEDGDLIVIEP